MTFEKKIKTMLEKNGLSPEQAEMIMVKLKASEANKSMKNRWNDSVDGYPDLLIHMMWATTKILTLEWIDAELPEAWFRPMFAQEARWKI